MYTQFQNISLFILRVIIAVIFLVSAYAKFPLWSVTATVSQMPTWLYYIMLFLSIAEIVGAVAVLVGYLTRLAAKCLGIVMLGAIYVMQFVMQMGFVTATGAGWNYPLMVLGGCVILAAFGPGAWAVKPSGVKA